MINIFIISSASLTINYLKEILSENLDEQSVDDSSATFWLKSRDGSFDITVTLDNSILSTYSIKDEVSWQNLGKNINIYTVDFRYIEDIRLILDTLSKNDLVVDNGHGIIEDIDFFFTKWQTEPCWGWY